MRRLSKTAQDTIDQVVWKARALPVRVGTRMVPSLIAHRASGATRVHLGAGSNLLQGWANLDMVGPSGLIRFDLNRPLPFPAATVRYTYSEHFIEHVTKTRAERLLAECARILEPGGVLRLSTPDLRTLVDEYRSGAVDEWADMLWHPETPCDLLNEGMRLWGHLYLWDEPALTAALRSAGFSEVVRRQWHASPHPELRDLECRPDHGDLILEATR